MSALVSKPIIISGCPRSGTTLMRSALNAHPNIYAGPECAYGLKAVEAVIATDKHIGHRAHKAFGLTEDETLRSYGVGWEYWLRCILDRNGGGKPRIADKMPQYCRHFGMMSYMIPDAVFIHVIRDPRDVAASLFDRTDMFGYETGEPVEFCQYADKAAEYWASEVGRGIQMRQHENAHRYYEVHYEALATEPRRVLGDLLEWLGEPWSEDVLNPDDGGLEWTNGDTSKPPHAKSVGRWQTRLHPYDAAVIEQTVPGLMQALGYERMAEVA